MGAEAIYDLFKKIELKEEADKINVKKLIATKF